VYVYSISCAIYRKQFVVESGSVALFSDHSTARHNHAPGGRMSRMSNLTRSKTRLIGSPCAGSKNTVCDTDFQKILDTVRSERWWGIRMNVVRSRYRSASFRNADPVPTAHGVLRVLHLGSRLVAGDIVPVIIHDSNVTLRVYTSGSTSSLRRRHPRMSSWTLHQ